MNVGAMTVAEMYSTYSSSRKDNKVADNQDTALNKLQKEAVVKNKDSEKSAGDGKKVNESVADGVVYEKTKETGKAGYTINKMSESDRAALVQKMKDEQAARQKQMLELVQKTLGEQAGAAMDADSVWKLFADGKVTVDEAARKEAEESISEDGYYGIKQTSQRLFDFASALAGDDVEQMKAMQEAMKKGFKQATAAWGKELPDICNDTLKAADGLFEEYYKSKETD